MLHMNSISGREKSMYAVAPEGATSSNRQQAAMSNHGRGCGGTGSSSDTLCTIAGTIRGGKALRTRWRCWCFHALRPHLLMATSAG